MSVPGINSGQGVDQAGQQAANQVQQYSLDQSIEQMWSNAKNAAAEKWVAVGDSAVQNMPTA